MRTIAASVGASLLALTLTGPVVLGGQEKPVNDGSSAKAEKAARELVAKFNDGDPGWRMRMAALVELARQGPATVPILVEALKKGSPSAREFAAQALVMFAEPSLRPALEQAVGDSEAGVRIYAIHALSMLGRLEMTERYRQMLDKDPSHWGVRPMLAAALARDDRPDPAALRKALAGYDLRQMDRARPGEMAPDFTLNDFTGKPQSLSQFRGKTVVLRFILFDF
jgi:HEAT repeat protein